ncbi:unnamed protein product [Absidia cylindrospora]
MTIGSECQKRVEKEGTCRASDDSETTVQNNNLGNLPYEIKKMIAHHLARLQNLDQLVLVNREFYAIADPILWQAPKIQGFFNYACFINTLRSARRPLSMLVKELHLSHMYIADVPSSLRPSETRNSENTNPLEEMEMLEEVNKFLTEAYRRRYPRINLVTIHFPGQCHVKFTFHR